MTAASTLLPTYATVNLSALAHNLSCIQDYLSPGCEVMAIVKANAYGHGAIEIAQALARKGIGRFAVASLEEGITLRQAGLATPIVVLGALFDQQLADLVAHRLTPVLSNGSILPALAQAASSHPSPYPVHLKIETGMGRLGFSPDELRPLLDIHHAIERHQTNAHFLHHSAVFRQHIADDIDPTAMRARRLVIMTFPAHN